MTCVAWFTSNSEAYLAKGLLESVQIQSYLADEHTVITHYARARSRGVGLMVPDEMADVAREVLNSRVPDDDYEAQTDPAEE